MDTPHESPSSPPSSSPTPSSAEATEALAQRFFAAIERADIDAVQSMYAPDVRVWHNVTGRTQTRAENLQLLTAFTQRLHGLRYEDVDRHSRPDGFSQRHTVRGKLPSGEPFELQVALFVNVENGLITELWEYLDGAGIDPVFPQARPQTRPRSQSAADARGDDPESSEPEGPLAEQLSEIEAALAQGRYGPGPWTGFLEECAAAPREDVAALAERITAVSNRLHARRNPRHMGFETAYGLEVLSAVIGLGALAAATLAGSGLLVVLFSMLLAATLQPVLKVGTGLLLGFSFSYAYLVNGEPRFKLRYGPYAAAERWKRVVYHLSGTLGSPLAWLLGGAAAMSAHPVIGTSLIGLCLAHLLFQASLGIAVANGVKRVPVLGALRLTSAGAGVWEWRAGRR